MVYGRINEIRIWPRMHYEMSQQGLKPKALFSEHYLNAIVIGGREKQLRIFLPMTPKLLFNFSRLAR